MGKSDSCAGPPPVFPTVLSKFRQNVEGATENKSEEKLRRRTLTGTFHFTFASIFVRT